MLKIAHMTESWNFAVPPGDGLLRAGGDRRSANSFVLGPLFDPLSSFDQPGEQ